jgi:hypothetical protein
MGAAQSAASCFGQDNDMTLCVEGRTISKKADTHELLVDVSAFFYEIFLLA